jgi:archaetidylinositol phosphate synthase
MTLYKKRQRFEKLSVKTGIVFSRLGLSANQWTGLTLIPTFIALYFLVKADFIPASLFFILSAFFDLIDGSVARVTGTASKLGAYLDTIMDRYVEFLIVLGLLFVALPDIFLPVRVWIFLYLFGSMMTTYSKAAAKEKGLVEDELKGGALERAERLIILFIGILLASVDTVFLSYILMVLAVLTNLSALQRIWSAVRG